MPVRFGGRIVLTLTLAAALAAALAACEATGERSAENLGLTLRDAAKSSQAAHDNPISDCPDAHIGCGVGGSPGGLRGDRRAVGRESGPDLARRGKELPGGARQSDLGLS